MPFQDATYKEAIIYCVDLVGQVIYNFPTAFTYTPEIVTSLVGVAVATPTSVTLTGSNTTGFIDLVGW